MNVRLSQLTYAYILGVSFLCCMTDVRLGPVQIVEFLQILGLGGIVLCVFAFRSVARADRETVFYAGLLFLWVAGIVLSIVMTFDPALVFVPKDATGMRAPDMVSFARLFQLTVILINVVFFAWCFTKSPVYLRAAAYGFLLGGVASTLFALMAFALIKLGGPELRGAYSLNGITRARGFFNEGGPFGLYIVAQIGIAVLTYRMGWIGLRLFIPLMIVLGLGFFASASLAGYLTLFAMAGAGIVLGPWPWYRKVAVVLILAVLGSVITVRFVVPKVNGYIVAYTARLSKSDARDFDPNADLGRVAAAYIVPRVISQNPVFGIGFGQYPLARNAAEYRGPLSFSSAWDLHGVGMLGLAAEIGIPLTVFLIYILLRPALSAWMRGRHWLLVIVGLYPLAALSIGTLQVNFFYPWLVLTIVIAIASCRYTETKTAPMGAKKAVQLSA